MRVRLGGEHGPADRRTDPGVGARSPVVNEPGTTPHGYATSRRRLGSSCDRRTSAPSTRSTPNPDTEPDDASDDASDDATVDAAGDEPTVWFYIEMDDGDHPDDLDAQLLRIPGVTAAYVTPDQGLP